MAILFNKAIPVNRLNLAFNNNIVQFYTDSTQTVLRSEITIGLTTITIYPEPSGFFYYNFKNLITSLINLNNYKDDLAPNLLTSYMYDWTNNLILSDLVTIKIFLSGDTEETTSFTPIWLSGYTQLEDYKRTYPSNKLLTVKSFLLSPTDDASNTVNYVKYWSGLPFDLTFWLNGEGLTLTNKTNGLDYVFANVGLGLVNRLVLSDGDTTTTLEDVLPLVNGFNIVDVNSDFDFQLEKVSDFCTDSHYLKWINSFGGWSYWLFDKGNRNRSVRSLGSLNNDFNNLEDTISPSINLGKESSDTLQLVQESITNNEFTLLKDILDSPKVYLFTGLAFSKNTFNDWMEVDIKSGNFRVENARTNKKTLSLNVDLPQRVTRYI